MSKTSGSNFVCLSRLVTPLEEMVHEFVAGNYHLLIQRGQIDPDLVDSGHIDHLRQEFYELVDPPHDEILRALGYAAIELCIIPDEDRDTFSDKEIDSMIIEDLPSNFTLSVLLGPRKDVIEYEKLTTFLCLTIETIVDNNNRFYIYNFFVS